jgi:hypothetical protein
MKRFALVRAVSLLLTMACAVIANAATVTPLPGSTPQATQVFCFFPVPIGVVVRDDAGNPIAGTAVTFQLPAPGFFVPNTGGNYVTVMTDANGVAMPKPGVVATNLPGTYSFNAVAAQGSATFNLVIDAGGPARMFTVSGSGQIAVTGTVFERPWVVQVLDAANNPVPYAWVEFAADYNGPTGTFEGSSFAHVAANGSGLATSPPFTAGGDTGAAQGTAFAHSDTGQGVVDLTAFIDYTIVAPRTIALMEYADSVALGTFTMPLRAVVVDSATQAPVAGARYSYATDPTCGWFSGSSVVEGFTNSLGEATVPLGFTGRALTLSCAITLTVEGMTQPLHLGVHVFNPNNVVITASQLAVDTTVNRDFLLTFSTTESGLPVNAIPLEVAVNASPSGAGATVLCCGLAQINTGLASVQLHANDKQGHYEIVVGYWNSPTVTIGVTQKVKR